MRQRPAVHVPALRADHRLPTASRLGVVHEPYFDPSPAAFLFGHVNAPSKPDASPYAAGSEKGGFTYIAHPIFSCYHQAGAVAMLEIAEKAIRHALRRERIVTTNAAARRPRHRAPPGRRRPRHRPSSACDAGAPRQSPRRQHPADPGPDHAQRHRRLARDGPRGDGR